MCVCVTVYPSLTLYCTAKRRNGANEYFIAIVRELFLLPDYYIFSLIARLPVGNMKAHIFIAYKFINQVNVYSDAYRNSVVHRYPFSEQVERVTPISCFQPFSTRTKENSVASFPYNKENCTRFCSLQCQFTLPKCKLFDHTLQFNSACFPPSMYTTNSLYFFPSCVSQVMVFLLVRIVRACSSHHVPFNGVVR